MYNKIKNYRKANGLTQKQVASLLGIDRSTYSYYETGKRSANVQIITKLAKIYRISIEELIDATPQDDNILKDDSMFYNHNDNKEENMSKYLSEIDDSEKQALLLFRLIKDKEEALEALKQMLEQEKEGEE